MDSDDSKPPTEVAFRKAAEMERAFYTRAEIAEAFRRVADSLGRQSNAQTGEQNRVSETDSEYPRS